MNGSGHAIVLRRGGGKTEGGSSSEALRSESEGGGRAEAMSRRDEPRRRMNGTRILLPFEGCASTVPSEVRSPRYGRLVLVALAATVILCLLVWRR